MNGGDIRSAGRPEVRSDLSELTGYHSPQVDVEVRLNTNEAPEAPPAGFMTALAEALPTIEWHRYPDRGAVRLRQALGRRFGLGPDRVFVANGSNEVLQTVLLTYAGSGRTCLTFEPTYALHSHLSRISGAKVVSVDRDDHYVLDPSVAVDAVVRHRPAVTFVCSPNNPTGVVEPRRTIVELLEAVESVGGLLVVDEAYGEFSPWSALELLTDERSMVVVKTYSKTWAMAGARLGYLLGPSWLVERLETVVLPYHLDAFKQLAGEIALGFTAEMNERVETIVGERDRLEAALIGAGAKVWPSGANFILFRPPVDGNRVWSELVDHSVLVRNTAGWKRLEGCLRVTVGTRSENDRFLAALADILER